MSIYDSLSAALGIEPNPELFERIRNLESIDLPAQYSPVTSREEAIIRNTTIVTCDRCGTSGGEPNMRRWHFDNCKTKFKDCKHCGKVIPRQGIKDYQYNKKVFCNAACYFENKKNKPALIMTDEVRKKLSEIAKADATTRSERMKRNQVWKKSNRWKTS